MFKQEVLSVSLANLTWTSDRGGGCSEDESSFYVDEYPPLRSGLFYAVCVVLLELIIYKQPPHEQQILRHASLRMSNVV